MCFSPEKHKLFTTVAQEGESNGLEIKRFKSAPQNKDIIITDFSSAKKIELTFEKNIVAQTFTVNQIINECALYDIINTSALIFNLQDEIQVQKDGKSLRLRKASLKDHTDIISAVFFETTIDKITEEGCYDLTKMRVQKYDDQRILKSTEQTEVTKNATLAIVKTENDYEKKSNEFDITGKITSIDLKSLKETYQCPQCTSTVDIIKALGWCEKCNHVSTQAACKSRAILKCGITADDSTKYFIYIPHALVEQKFKLKFVNLTSNDIVPKVINKKLLFTLDTSYKCIKISDVN